MKLLIVDDEELTRTGVISSIDWNALGIRQVFQADDGIHGLEAARLHRPEIILCDVRMPRMDGITMLEHLESILPDTIPIFMSGYSDKEYLKAAIKLKAVSYIEKPLDPEEIREAVLDAREAYLQKVRSHRGETLHSMETASRLALQLTTPCGSNRKNIDGLIKELDLHLTENTFFTAFIVKMSATPDLPEVSREEFHDSLTAFFRQYRMNCIYAEKHAQYIVYFVFGEEEPSREFIQAAGEFLGSSYAPLGKHFVTAGDTVSGIANASRSYTSAVILLQSCFFFPCNSFLTAADAGNAPGERSLLEAEPEAVLAKALSEKNRDACEELLRHLYDYFFENPHLLSNQVKDVYYKLFLALEDARRQLRLTGGSSSEKESIAEALENCFTFQELHESLVKKAESFFTDSGNAKPENPTILLIRDYISQNYGNETLSVKDISNHVFLSASYVCTFFKSETGQTLNQYLTEYRMEQAKQLLADSRYRISEISSRVGYSDGNYFGKSFKKYTGLSPSEYREKMLK